jgi:hypothetical protein
MDTNGLLYDKSRNLSSPKSEISFVNMIIRKSLL